MRKWRKRRRIRTIRRRWRWGGVVEDMAEEEVEEEEEVVSEGAGGQPIADGHDAVAMAVEVQVAGVEGGVAVMGAVSVHAVALNGLYTHQALEHIRDATPWGQMPLPLFPCEIRGNLTQDQIQDLFDTDFFEKEEEEEEEVKAGQKLPKRKAEEGQDHSLKAAEVVELELGR
ncbi:hypothetical protein B484DRAFT_412512 [Ochromonadaceae sp. CCMP2298]|nr:hypothetical protein B484DRAFT_412512 [Ochromonadaceae sp. CCMP2298]